MNVKSFNLCYVIALILLCAISVESKRSFGLIRSRPKPNNNLSIRRRQQAPVQYTPQSSSSNTASHAAAAKPAVAKPVAPVASAPQGPPPPYSAQPGKIGWTNPGAAPPAYNPHHALPPSYQSAMGSGANYPRQAYGVNSGAGAYGHAMPPNYPGAGGVGHTPYGHGGGGAGLYNNHYNPGMAGGGGMNPGMAMGGMGMGMGMNGGGMGMMNGGGMGMHSMGGGYMPQQQKSGGMFSGSPLMTGLAMYGAYRGIGSMVGGVMGSGRHGGYGYGDSTQHVYVHHVNQNQPGVVTTVNGTPIMVEAIDTTGGAAVGGVNAGAVNTGAVSHGVNGGAQTLNTANVNSQSWATAAPAAIAAVGNNATDAPACTENCPDNIDTPPQMPIDMPVDGLDAYPTIHPSLFTYAGGSDEILYWANTHNKNLTMTAEGTTKAD